MRYHILLCIVYVKFSFALSIQDEQNIIDQFRERITENQTNRYMKTDLYLSKWLKSTGYDLNEAIEMFHENLEWRQENSIDNLLEADFSDLEQEYPYHTDTHDKQGRPLGHINFGRWDLRAAAVQGKLRRLSLYMCRFFETGEHLLYKAREAGSNITTVLAIVDVEGFNDIQHMCTSCVTVFIQFIDCYESHYPFLGKEMIYINAPAKFKTLVSYASPILRSYTVETLRYFDDKRKWMPYLDERIDRDQRYSYAGGTKEP